MKKIAAVLALLSLFLSGCGRSGKILVEPVYLYYPKAEYDFGYADSVIDYEAMDGTGQMNDLLRLLSEYFSGPIDEALTNPFPAGTALLSADIQGDTVHLALSEEASALPEHLFALGCTCLSMTCFELTECENVTVSSGQRLLTIPRDSWMLLDDYSAPKNTESK